MTRPLTAVVGLLVLVNGTAPHAQRAARPAVGVESHIVALWRTCNECIGQGHEPVDERARRQHPVGSDRIRSSPHSSSGAYRPPWEASNETA